MGLDEDKQFTLFEGWGTDGGPGFVAEYECEEL